MADTNLATLCLQIANAIRSKRGITDKIKPIDFPTEIGKIGSGGTADASKVVSGYSIYTADGLIVGTFTPVDTIIQPDITDISLSAPEGKWYRNITVNKVTSAIDSNIKAGNIKKGVTILGVTGTLEEGTGLVRVNYTLTNCSVVGGTSGKECIDVGDTTPIIYIEPAEGYTVANATVTVTNNGVDITSTVWSVATVSGVQLGKIDAFRVNGTVGISVSTVLDVHKLPTPQNVTISSARVVSWTAVPNATSYRIKSESITTGSTPLYKTTTSTSYDLKTWTEIPLGTNNIFVQALSTSSQWSESDYSESAMYTNTVQIAAPTLTVNNGVLSWNAIEHSNGYLVSAIQTDGSEKYLVPVNATTVNASTIATTKGTYNFTVQATADYPYVNSKESNTVSWTITNPLAAPTNLYLSEQALSYNANFTYGNVSNTKGDNTTFYCKVDTPPTGENDYTYKWTKGVETPTSISAEKLYLWNPVQTNGSISTTSPSTNTVADGTATVWSNPIIYKLTSNTNFHVVYYYSESAPQTTTISGTYNLKDTLTLTSNFEESVGFTSGGTAFDGMKVEIGQVSNSLAYKYSTPPGEFPYVSAYSANTSGGSGGYTNDNYKTVNFGTTAQTVSVAFKEWIESNSNLGTGCTVTMNVSGVSGDTFYVKKNSQASDTNYDFILGYGDTKTLTIYSLSDTISIVPAAGKKYSGLLNYGTGYGTADTNNIYTNYNTLNGGGQFQLSKLEDITMTVVGTINPPHTPVWLTFKSTDYNNVGTMNISYSTDNVTWTTPSSEIVDVLLEPEGQIAYVYFKYEWATPSSNNVNMLINVDDGYPDFANPTLSQWKANNAAGVVQIVPIVKDQTTMIVDVEKA